MALASRFGRVFGGSSSIIKSQLAFIHQSSTLTAPNIFVSGLLRQTTDDKVKEAFSPFGHILDAKVITDRVTADKEEMNAKFLDGWVIFVNPSIFGEQKKSLTRGLNQKNENFL
ncbi:hypothetical protein UlMin_006942 [Ulmus minor]